MKQTIIIFGGLGFVGLPLCITLSRLNYRVICVNRNADNPNLFKRVHPLKENNVIVVDSTIIDSTVISEYKPQLIINLIQSRYQDSLHLLLDNDIKVHQYLLDRCKKEKVIYMYASNQENTTVIGTAKKLMDVISDYYRNNNSMIISSICLAPIIDSEMDNRQYIGRALFTAVENKEIVNGAPITRKTTVENKEIVNGAPITRKTAVENKEIVNGRIAPITRKTAVEFIACISHGALAGDLPLQDKYTVCGPFEYSFDDMITKNNSTRKKISKRNHFLLQHQEEVDIDSTVVWMQEHLNTNKPGGNIVHIVISIILVICGVYLFVRIKPDKL